MSIMSVMCGLLRTSVRCSCRSSKSPDVVSLWINLTHYSTLNLTVNRQQPVINLLSAFMNRGQAPPANLQEASAQLSGETSSSARAPNVPAAPPFLNANGETLVIECSVPQPQPLPQRSAIPRTFVRDLPQYAVGQESVVSTNTLGGLSPQTAYTHQPATSVMETTDEEGDEEEQKEDDMIVIGTKRTASQRQSSEFEEGIRKMSSLSRRRATSNLKKDEPQHASSEDMLMQSPTKSDAQLPSSESEPWLSNVAVSQTSQKNNPLKGWGPRTQKPPTAQAHTSQLSTQVEMEGAEEVTDGKTLATAQIDGGGDVVGSQRRSQRPPQQKKAFPGQTYYPGKVPNFAKGR